MAEETVSILAVLVDKISGPLAGISSKFQKMQGDLARIGTTLTTVNSQFAAFTASIGAAVGISSSIAASEQAVRAEQRLLTALRGRTKELDKIKAATAELQRVTEFEGDALNEVAATMLELGIAAEDIPKSLKVAVNTAAAIGQPIQTVVRSLSQFDEESFGRLSRFVPELQKLKDEGRLAADGIDLLATKFKDVAEQQANTVFGRITQVNNRIGDLAERIGEGFARLKLIALESVEPIVTRIADFLDSGHGRALLDLIGKMLPMLVQIGAVIAGIFAALGAFNVIAYLTPIIGALLSILGTLISISVTIIAGIFTPIGAIAAAITGILILVGHLTGFFDKLGETASEFGDAIGFLFSQFSGIIKKIGEGRLSVEDLFDFLTTRGKQLFAFVEFLGKAIGIILGGIVNRVKANAKTLVSGVIAALLNVANLLTKGILLLVKTFATQLDQMVNLIQKGLEKAASAVGKTITFTRSNLAASIPEEIQVLDTFTKAANETFMESAAEMVTAIPNVFRDLVAARSDYIGETLSLELGLINRLNKSEGDHEREKLDRRRKEIEGERIKNAAILSANEEFLKDLARVRSTTGLAGGSADTIIAGIGLANTEGKDALTAIAKEKLQAQFDSNAIAAEKFLNDRAELERKFALAEAARLDALIKKSQEHIVQLAASKKITGDTLEDLKEEVRVNGAVGEETKKLVDLEKRRQTIVFNLFQIETGIRDLRIQVAQGEVGRLKEVQSRMDELNADIAKRLTKGETSPLQALDAVNKNLDAFAKKIQSTRTIVNALLNLPSTDPKLKKALEDINHELDRLQSGVSDSRGSAASQAIAEVNARLDLARQENARVIAEAQRREQRGFASSVETRQVTDAANQALRGNIEDAANQLTTIAEKTPEATKEVTKLNAELATTSAELSNDIAPAATNFTSGFISGMDEAIRAMTDLNKVGMQFGRTLTEGIAEGIEVLATKGSAGFKEFARTFLIQIGQMILRTLIMIGLQAAFNALIPGLGWATNAQAASQAAATVGAISSTATVQRASGGIIPGPNVNADVVSARLTPGEFVVRKSAVDYYGQSFMSQLNSRNLPRVGGIAGASRVNTSGFFADGGVVGPGSSFSTPPIGFIPANEQTMSRLLAGGRNAMLEFMRAEAPTIFPNFSRGA